MYVPNVETVRTMLVKFVLPEVFGPKYLMCRAENLPRLPVPNVLTPSFTEFPAVNWVTFSISLPIDHRLRFLI